MHDLSPCEKGNTRLTKVLGGTSIHDSKMHPPWQIRPFKFPCFYPQIYTGYPRPPMPPHVLALCCDVISQGASIGAIWDFANRIRRNKLCEQRSLSLVYLHTKTTVDADNTQLMNHVWLY